MFKACQLTHKELIALSRGCVPRLTPQLYKGQCGKICVVGGCEEYTGAPYFSANAASLFGSDLVYLICETKASTAIKAYSPNLMVHPYLLDTNSMSQTAGGTCPYEKIDSVLERSHVVVVGPGLGRDAEMFEQVMYIVEKAHEGSARCLLLDADALFLLAHEQHTERMQRALKKYGRDRVVITPNAVELKRIMRALKVDRVEQVSEALGCITVAKGTKDVIVNSHGDRLTNEVPGSMRRCGGQGDTLTGIIAAMLGFSRAVHDTELASLADAPEGASAAQHTVSWAEMAMLSCYVGSTATRMSSRMAYESAGRQLQTTDVNGSVGEAFRQLYVQ